MFDNGREKAERLLEMATLLGKSKIISQVQSMLVPKVVEIFSEHDNEDLRRMILTDYDLVKNHTPPGIKQTLQNVGSSRETRQYFEAMVMESITPENIIKWLRNPEEWLDADEAAEQREELRQCADVIENTQGGMEWLERQVLDVYRMANIVPEEPSPAKATE